MNNATVVKPEYFSELLFKQTDFWVERVLLQSPGGSMEERNVRI